MNFISKLAFALGFAGAGSLSLLGCSSPETTTTTTASAAESPASTQPAAPNELGGLRLSLSTGDRQVSTVTAIVTSSEGSIQTHEIDVTGDDGTISIFLGGLEDGEDYVVRLIADGCEGVANFSIRHDQTTLVDVALNCSAEADAGSGSGSVQITGHFVDAGAPVGVCDPVLQIKATPSLQSGTEPSLVELSLRPGVTPSAIRWLSASTTGATGVIADDSGPADSLVAFDCTSDGTAYVIADVTVPSGTGSCVEHARIAVECVNQGDPPPPPPKCGDGLVNQASEECDGSALPADAGASTCSADCKLVTPLPPSSCGNGTIEGSEQCDGEAFPVGAPVGACTADCKIVRCGDGVINQTAEQCDGTDLPASAPAGSTCSVACSIVPPGVTVGACGVCAQSNCINQRAQVDADTNSAPIIECVLGSNWKTGERAPANSCGNLDLLSCFCGTLQGQECANAAPSALTGPCSAEILVGTGCSVSSCVATAFLNPDNANGKAMQYIQCQQDFCFGECFNP